MSTVWFELDKLSCAIVKEEHCLKLGIMLLIQCSRRFLWEQDVAKYGSKEVK